MIRLSLTVILKVLDVDLAIITQEVLNVIRNTVPADDNDSEVVANKYDIIVTGLWEINSGQQVSTVRVSRAVVTTIT